MVKRFFFYPNPKRPPQISTFNIFAFETVTQIALKTQTSQTVNLIAILLVFLSSTRMADGQKTAELGKLFVFRYSCHKHYIHVWLIKAFTRPLAFTQINPFTHNMR